MMEQRFLVVLCHMSDRVYKVKRVNNPLMDDFDTRRRKKRGETKE
jgi:hypothetical protein